MSYRLQLWAGVRYGLGALSVPLRELGELTKNFAYRVLPSFGINRHIRTGWRYLHSAFSGCGLLDLATESSISRLNMFLQHWDNPAPVGQALRASMECLQLEIGCQGFPLHEDFSFMGDHVTHSWARSFWECMDRQSIHLEVDYPVIPIPRENDRTILQIAQDLNITGGMLESVQRCRISTESIFLSDLTNAAGNAIDTQRAGKQKDYCPPSKFRFPTNNPSQSDWDNWWEFWRRYCLQDGSLPRTLGKWTSDSHKEWIWFYDSAADMVLRKVEAGAEIYHATGDTSQVRTRRQHVYARTGVLPDLPDCTLLPISVEVCEQGTVMRLASGPPLWNEKVQKPGDFLDFLRSWGGSWMWEDLHIPGGLRAVVQSIREGTARLVTDGSYNRGVRPDVSSAGWLIYCTKRKKILLTCSFHETTAKAGSYRGELLGLTSIHIFLNAIEEYFGVTCHDDCVIACDNIGALQRCQERRKKVPSGAKHGDIRRVLRKIHYRIKGRPNYIHVYGHQDDRKRWDQLTPLEKLNYHCDNLAKAALLRGTLANHDRSVERQRLPLESAAVFVKGSKLTGECGEEIRFVMGRTKARRFYLEDLGWMAATFDAVDWEARDQALSRTSDMFRTWLCKQCSSFCATGRNMERWFDSEATACPNCRIDDETADHLLHCFDPGRTAFFNDEVKSLQGWLTQEHTDPELASALSRYIQGRGIRTFRDCVGTTRNRLLLKLADQQDVIGWDHMMEGKVATLFRQFQHLHLVTSPSMLNADDWIRQYITKLLHITHGQWIYRNVSRHHHKHGLLQDLERQSLLREIDKFLSLSADDVPEESRFLLEIDFRSIRTAATEKQSYWVHAMRAAVKAGRRVAQRNCSGSAAAPTVPTATTRNIDHIEQDLCTPVNSGGLAAAVRGVKRGAGSLDDQSNKRRRPD